MTKTCKSVLIIEDDQVIRETLQLAVEGEGYTVFTAANGKIGIESLERVPRPTLILLDLMMPVMNGWEFINAHALQEQFKDNEIVTISASNINTSMPTIKKPIDLDVLFPIIGRYFGRPSTGEVCEAP